ncbi:cupin domain-containing protein [Saccharopolyspora sp. HNM0983]|uniref:Cupin domain-containing protein n=1 Tax=Saccharopolyspora montiporae TaxID=2781240 RepID=A0A929BD54_9PSEU|nr:cupin domain-containing protein [Saccharopolyspora sp. HNM0983]MBE9375327.1 cupin domain-containing protein [Saccharopolyspora sp. HNM0983]
MTRAAEVDREQRPNGRVVTPLSDRQVPGLGRVAHLLATHHPHFAEDRHFHRWMCETFYFLDDAAYWIDGRTEHVAAGDLVVIEPGEPHGALPVPHQVRILVHQLPKVDGDKHPWSG